MKKIILKVILLIALLFVIDTVVGMLGNRMLDNAKWRKFGKEKYVLDVDTSDIVIFGSSRAAVHYVSKEISFRTNKTVFNAGQNGKGLPYSLGLLKGLLSRATPKYVVLDILAADVSGENTDNGFGINGAISSLKPYYNRNVIITNYLNKYLSFFERKTLLINSYKFNSDWLSLLGTNYSYNNVIADLGYEPNNKPESKLDFSESDVYVANMEKLEFLLDFINEVQSHNCGLIIVYSPSTYVLNSETEKLIQDICKLHNIPFWNFSKTSNDLKQYKFADPTHLTIDGAYIFSENISDSINTYMFF